jgi:hypothetical protein
MKVCALNQGESLIFIKEPFPLTDQTYGHGMVEWNGRNAMTPEHTVLRVLLREVLQQTTQDQAVTLVGAFNAGKILTLTISVNSRGAKHKCMLQWRIGEDPRLISTQGNA